MVDPLEGIVTFLFFGVLVLVAYAADKDFFLGSGASVAPLKEVPGESRPRKQAESKAKPSLSEAEVNAMVAACGKANYSKTETELIVLQVPHAAIHSAHEVIR